MDDFTSFNENFVLALFAVLLLMATWGCAIVVIDRWVWAGRSDVPYRELDGNRIAPQDDEA